MKKIVILLTGLVLLGGNNMSANAQNSLEEITLKLRSLGEGLHVQTIDELYKPLLDAAPKGGVDVSWNIAYGEHERHRLDIYQPSKKAEKLSPILVFVHGGAFVAGHKDNYKNVGYYFARKGITTVVSTYRLAPDHKWPAGTEDLAAVLKWMQSHPDQLATGDTDKIFLMGHSAGGAHVATYAFIEDLQTQNDGVIGAILISGSSYDLTQMSTAAYYGDDPSKLRERSIINHLDGRKIPIFLAVAEYDLPPFQRQFNILQNALYERDGVLPMSKLILDHTHISETRHINTEDESLGPDVIRFILSKASKTEGDN